MKTNEKNTIIMILQQIFTHHSYLQMFLLQRNSESINNGPQNLQQFPHSIMTTRLVNIPEKHLRDGLSYVRSIGHEFPIHSMQHGLHIVSFTGIFRVKQFNPISNECLVDILLGYFTTHFCTHYKSQEKLVHNL